MAKEEEQKERLAQNKANQKAQDEWTDLSPVEKTRGPEGAAKAEKAEAKAEKAEAKAEAKAEKEEKAEVKAEKAKPEKAKSAAVAKTGDHGEHSHSGTTGVAALGKDKKA